MTMLSSSQAMAALILTTAATLLVLMTCLTCAAPVDTIVAGSAAGDSDSHLDMKREKRESFDMLGFLTEFGYLPVFTEDEKGQFQSEDVVSTAIEEFQRFNGLEVTGYPDPATLTLMKTPRCGVPDIVQDNAIDVTGPESPMAYTTFGTRWMKDTVTWNVTALSSKLPERDQWRAFQRALDLWENEIPIKFRFSTHQPDIEIFFARGEHGDGWQNRFKGKGGVLAHAFRPGAGIGGDTHFDEDEDWVMGSGEGTDLSFVAAHEFGHALGLAHSSVPGSLMQPFYRPSQDIKLHQDDIRGIQALYGSKRTPKPPYPSSPPQTSTTTTTTTTTEMPPQVPPFCDDSFRLDAISDGPGGFMYAYRADKIYKLGPRGLEFGSPQALTEVFPGAPSRHVRAVAYVPGTGKTYMFKNSRVWRFSGFQLDYGYPRVWTHDRNFQPSAALTLTYHGHSQIFMFGHNYFWEWSTYTESMVPGYPLDSETYFPYAPLLPDAAFMNSNGNFIFFKYNDFKKLEHRGMDAELLPLGPNMFGSVCGGRPSLLQSHRRVLSDQPFGVPSQRETTHEMNFSPLVRTLIKGDNDSDQHRDSLGDHGLSRRWHSRHHERKLGRWNRLGRVNSFAGYFTRKFNRN